MTIKVLGFATLDNYPAGQSSYTEDGFNVTATALSAPSSFYSFVHGAQFGGALVDFEGQYDTIANSAGSAAPFDAVSVQLLGRSTSQFGNVGYDYTFTGVKADGTVVSQSFLIGTQTTVYRTFYFDSSFTDLVSLKTSDDTAWGFADIRNLTFNTDPPTAVNDSIAVNEFATKSGNVLTNDSGVALGVSTIQAGTTGPVTTVNASGNTTYGPSNPSLDRIKCNGPYSDRNTRVVLLGVNSCRGAGGRTDMQRTSRN